MATLTVRAAAVLGVLWATGCGDALVDDGYRGPVLFTLRGNVMGASDNLALDAMVRIAMFWSPSGPTTLGTDGLVEQPTAAQQATPPFSFTLNLFDSAPKALFYTPTDHSRGSYAIAQILGYPDLNNNQQRDDNETIVAASAGRAVLYVATPLTSAQSPTGVAMSPGYHLIFSAIPCGGPAPVMPAPPPGMTCTVPFGDPCSSDAQCAPGICVKDFLAPWPQGGCVAADPPPPGCGPPMATRISPPGPSMAGSTYWLKSCVTDADCGRGFPYQCDLALGACAPTQSLLMTLGDPPSIALWCR